MLWGHRKWSARDDLHVQGCLILSQAGLLFPVNHAPLKLASLTGFAPVISCTGTIQLQNELALTPGRNDYPENGLSGG